MKRWGYIAVVAFFAQSGYSQSPARTSNYADLTIGIGSYQGSMAVSAVHRWGLGSGKWGLGLGARFTSYLGANQYYMTAPATLTSESSSPLIIFKESINENIDTLLMKSPQVNALNLSFNLDYHLTQKVMLGLNIDLIGFSFGGSRHGNYINGPQGKNTVAKPTPFNILLISDNDQGSLNSEFFIKYFLDKRWAAKIGGQFLFTEYTTATKVQQLPMENDRFRNKSLMLALGVSLKL